MALRDAVTALRTWTWLPARRRRWTVGGAEVADARRLADAERAVSGGPDGCAWLDDRTVEDLDLPLVFRAIDRTVTPTGAQALWRWLVAPAARADVLAERERSLARLAGDPALRDRLRDALAGPAAADAPQLPRLLWEPAPAPIATPVFAALAAAVVVLVALAAWWTPLLIAGVVLFIANVWIDDWVSSRIAPQSRALELLRQHLTSADEVIARGLWRDPAIASELAAFAGFRKYILSLTVSDPLGIAELVRAGLFVRLLLLGRWMQRVDHERDRLRRLVLWVGELDALVSIASLRAERPDARLPQLSSGPAQLVAGELVHPAIDGAIGNDVALDGGLLVTGSNMSGKSTFLRAVAINAICAQSIHTTFGHWRAPLFRVLAVMRVADATAEGMSTYAVEVDAIGVLVDAVAPRERALPVLLVIDEPFSGTNPALRVPIVVSVLDYLGERDTVIAATHDLDVAAQVSPRFARGYLCEPDGDGRFDHRLRPGISPSSNALLLLRRAGYPAALVDAVERRARIAS
jgi:hypothetical protein